MKLLLSLLTGLFLSPGALSAQRVTYSDYLVCRSGETIRFAGQAGEHYWVEKESPARHRGRNDGAAMPERNLFCFDRQLQNPVPVAGAAMPYDKMYLVAGPGHFDQLAITREGSKTRFSLLRFSEDGLSAETPRSIDSLSFGARPDQVFLSRSADKSRILLLVFQTNADETPCIYSTLFDQDWQVLHRARLRHDWFTQPFIQDDVVGLPAESTDNLPVKVSRSGEWVMASVSRTNGNFLLFHACPDGNSVTCREVPLSRFFQMEDLGMGLDEDSRECTLGLLSRYRRTTLKNAQVSRYSLTEDRFLFDSAYHFNSLAARVFNQNLVQESFVAIPGGGYMLFKEYGRQNGAPGELSEPPASLGDPLLLSTQFAAGETASAELKQDAYMKRSGLQGIRSVFHRGNLTMFYFPGISGDSTWSGLINTEQTTELNAPTLSYLIYPTKEKIVILYHGGAFNPEPGMTTSLDRHGRETGDAVLFWKLNRDLDFQAATRISESQVVIPFHNNQLTGFALVRMN